MKKKKPVGVILFSIFTLFYGFVSTLFAILLITAFLIPESQFSVNLLSNIKRGEMHKTFWAVSLHEIPICLVYAFLGICAFVSGIGILTLQDWGRKLFMLLAVYDIFENILNSIVLKEPLLSMIPWIIFDCVILFYFTRTKVKEQFE